MRCLKAAAIIIVSIIFNSSTGECADKEAKLYDNAKLGEPVGILDASKGEVYFAFYGQTLPAAVKQKIKESQQLDLEVDGKSFSVICYIQLKVRPGQESFETTDVTGYVMEFTGSDGGPPLNWIQPSADGKPDLSSVKYASGKLKLGEKINLKMEGSKSFEALPNVPDYKWSLDASAELLVAWG